MNRDNRINPQKEYTKMESKQNDTTDKNEKRFAANVSYFTQRQSGVLSPSVWLLATDIPLDSEINFGISVPNLHSNWQEPTWVHSSDMHEQTILAIGCEEAPATPDTCTVSNLDRGNEDGEPIKEHELISFDVDAQPTPPPRWQQEETASEDVEPSHQHEVPTVWQSEEIPASLHTYEESYLEQENVDVEPLYPQEATSFGMSLRPALPIERQYEEAPTSLCTAHLCTASNFEREIVEPLTAFGMPKNYSEVNYKTFENNFGDTQEPVGMGRREPGVYVHTVLDDWEVQMELQEMLETGEVVNIEDYLEDTGTLDPTSPDYNFRYIHTDGPGPSGTNKRPRRDSEHDEDRSESSDAEFRPPPPPPRYKTPKGKGRGKRSKR